MRGVAHLSSTAAALVQLLPLLPPALERCCSSGICMACWHVCPHACDETCSHANSVPAASACTPQHKVHADHPGATPLPPSCCYRHTWPSRASSPPAWCTHWNHPLGPTACCRASSIPQVRLAGLCRGLSHGCHCAALCGVWRARRSLLEPAMAAADAAAPQWLSATRTPTPYSRALLHVCACR